MQSHSTRPEPSTARSRGSRNLRTAAPSTVRVPIMGRISSEPPAPQCSPNSEPEPFRSFQYGVNAPHARHRKAIVPQPLRAARRSCSAERSNVASGPSKNRDAGEVRIPLRTARVCAVGDQSRRCEMSRWVPWHALSKEPRTYRRPIHRDTTMPRSYRSTARGNHRCAWIFDPRATHR